jgi:hypothetical protein
VSHTPGPWLWFSTVGGRLIVGAEADGEDIFFPIEGEVAREVHGRGNARLIAAAPDLLAALQTFLAEADSWHNETGHEDSDPIIHCDAICAARGPAREAIAKATQGNPQ